MLPDYSDIRSRIAEEPTWYDGNGAPRYGTFNPDMLGVYDTYALLAEIECQSCARVFLIGEGWPRYSLVGEPRFWTLEGLATGYHFGDPPFHGVGEHPMCGGIVEAWERLSGFPKWHRRPDIERIDIYPEWAGT